jgi:hypothetical protein
MIYSASPFTQMEQLTCTLKDQGTLNDEKEEGIEVLWAINRYLRRKDRGDARDANLRKAHP